MKWRIGDGSIVQIYQDKWLLGSEHGGITSPLVDLTLDATVSILIDHEQGQWREDEVDRLFISKEATVIKAIPLSYSSKRDMIFWPNCRDGVCSVKSGYKKLMELEEENKPVANTSSVNELKSTWNAIWKLQVPNRIKLLMWRAGSDSLPTKVNLTKRMLLIEATCNQCNEGPEDTFHALWMCP
nr:putative ribonuclease h protein [Quercus suber]